MSDARTTCDGFDQALLDGDVEIEGSAWSGHLADCATCREQWHTHRLLAATFAGRAVPELSPAFDAGLQRRVATSRVEVRSLRGWRSVAMAAYGVAAGGVLVWVLQDVPMPSIDLTRPWVPIIALAAVPLSFLAAIAASRWLPRSVPPPGPSLLAL